MILLPQPPKYLELQTCAPGQLFRAVSGFNRFNKKRFGNPLPVAPADHISTDDRALIGHLVFFSDGPIAAAEMAASHPG